MAKPFVWYPGLLAAAAAIAATSMADAESLTAVVGDGDYELQCNANGYVVQFNAAGSGAIREAIGNTRRGEPPLYLGRSCDAASDSLGGGKWCWGVGGFVVDLAEATLDLPGQRPGCDPLPTLGEDCLC
jgi:hypothetical protein